MRVQGFDSVEWFLEQTRAALELDEAVDSLMLGLCGALIEHPERFAKAPCLKTVADEEGLVLAALMTPPHNLIVYHHRGDLQAGAAALVEAVVREGWPVPGTIGPSETASQVARAWAVRTGRQARLAQRLRVYKLRQVAIPPPQRGRLRLATEGDADLVAAWYYAFQHGIHGQADEEQSRRAAGVRIGAGDIFVWEDGRVVSIAMQNRPTRRGISVGLVYTPPELRGRGYATACVSELSRRLLASGWEFCALFADVANPTANGIYRRIGYEPVCDYHEVRFEDR
jgi:predicted GNAT family acetyltransferase